MYRHSSPAAAVKYSPPKLYNVLQVTVHSTRHYKKFIALYEARACTLTLQSLQSQQIPKCPTNELKMQPAINYSIPFMHLNPAQIGRLEQKDLAYLSELLLTITSHVTCCQCCNYTDFQ